MKNILDLNKMGLDSMNQNDMNSTEGGSWEGVFKWVVGVVVDTATGLKDGVVAGWNAANNG